MASSSKAWLAGLLVALEATVLEVQLGVAMEWEATPKLLVLAGIMPLLQVCKQTLFK
jgi:hypothetical protein